MKIDFPTLKDTFHSILVSRGFADEAARTMARVFAETTLDGVFSHGVNRFPRFIGAVDSGIVKPGSKPQLVNGMQALEQWDGCQGAGILNALHCADRSVELAGTFGIGGVGLRNTNHWMRGGTYGWRVAERGFLFLGWTNTIPNMPPWGGEVPALGNNPFVMAIPNGEESIVLDMAMSQYAYGKLEWMKKSGQELAEFGGYDSRGALTKDPSEILNSQRILPMGLWKGSAFSLVLDLAAAILSGGNSTRHIGELPEETNLSQVFISVSVEHHLGEAQRKVLVEEALQFLTEENVSAQYPGQRVAETRKYHLKQGLEIPDEIWDEIKQL
jgi:3-dehydro-L-gulonate 2-dehydrogenase